VYLLTSSHPPIPVALPCGDLHLAPSHPHLIFMLRPIYHGENGLRTVRELVCLSVYVRDWIGHLLPPRRGVQAPLEPATHEQLKAVWRGEGGH
jgi:hypothetical protein